MHLISIGRQFAKSCTQQERERKEINFILYFVKQNPGVFAFCSKVTYIVAHPKSEKNTNKQTLLLYDPSSMKWV
jgi:hypothetical protein